MIAGYEPARIASLRWHTLASIAALDAITSSDPAITDALHHVRNLRRVLDTDLMSALTAIQDRDPLARTAQRSVLSDPSGSTRFGWPRWRDIVEEWQSRGDQPLTTEFAELTLFELAMRVRFELTRQVEENGMLDPTDPFWGDTFTDLVTEFEQRAATDPEFSTWLVSEAADNPLIGLIVAEGDFDGSLVVSVTTAIIESEHLGSMRDAYRGEAVAALLQQIAAEPVLSLDLLDDHDVVEALFTWNDDAFLVSKIPDELLADLIINGLVVAPAIDDELTSTVYEVFGSFVELATTHFDDGFEPIIGVALAIAVGAHAPAFLESAQDYCSFDMRNDTVVVPIGTRADLVEFFGALMHGTAPQSVLTTIIHELAADAEPGGPGITPEAVSAFTVLLDEALEHENLEFSDQAASIVSGIDFGTAIVNFVAGQILSGTGAGSFAKFLVSLGIKQVGQRVGDTVDTDTIGIADLAVLGDLVIELELLRDALEPGAPFRASATPAAIRAARRALDEVDQRFADGASSYAEIESAMRSLRAAAGSVAAPIDYTPYVSRDLDDASHPCDEANRVPPHRR